MMNTRVFALVSIFSFSFAVLPGCDRDATSSPKAGPALANRSAMAVPATEPRTHETQPPAAALGAHETPPPAAASRAPVVPAPSVRPTDRANAGDNVLLITLDTTRADRLGCYGWKDAVTPTLDALAKQGTLFEQAFTAVPITLPSHASILTGKYPREHGLSDNGRERLSQDQVTLAELAHDRGYKTGAFVASYVLDARFGLAHGFDTYNDDMGAHDRSTDPLHWEEPANVVTDRALAWLESAKSSPFFCWVHYYDAHDPYAPPEAFAHVGADRYDGEIAFVDTQVRRLTDWLAHNKLDGKTLVVVVGDHGESFGEHREVGHTMFVYDTNIHVPMIFAHPKLIKPGQRVRTVVETVDVFPTVVALLNWDAQAEAHTRSLAPALAGRDLEPGNAYSETLFGLHMYGWCEQRSLTTARWKYVASVKPELFDRQADPGEKKNLVDAQPERAREMDESLRQRFQAMHAGQADVMDFDSRSRQALATLGYTGGGGLSSTDFLTSTYDDPKDNLDVVRLFMAARRATREGREEVALLHLFNAKERAPNSAAIQSALGAAALVVYDKQAKQANGVGEFTLLDKARDAFVKTLELDPMDERAMASLGDVLVRQRRYDDAVKQYRLVLEGRSEYPEVHVKLAVALREAGRPQEAVAEYKKALALDPSLADASYDLGVYYLAQHNPNEALRFLHEAVRFSPKEPQYRYNLGLALFQLDQFQDAVDEFKIAVELDANFTDAVINLGIAQFQAGQIGAAQATLMRASQDPRTTNEAFYNLGVVMEKQDKPTVAIGFYMRTIKSRPDHPQAVDRVTRLLLSQGKARPAARVLRGAVAARPDKLSWVNGLAFLLATTKNDKVRSGSEAVALAQRALALAGDQRPGVLRTLAAAYAESGRFEDALTTVDQAIKLARENGGTAFVKRLQVERNAYVNAQPVRSETY